MQPDYDLYFLTIFFIFSQFFCFFFTEEGFHRGLKFGHRIIYSQKHFFEPWCYEKIQIDGVIPFYRMYVYKKILWDYHFCVCKLFKSYNIYRRKRFMR